MSRAASKPAAGRNYAIPRQSADHPLAPGRLPRTRRFMRWVGGRPDAVAARWREVLLAAGSGLALAAGFPTWNWWPTAFFALAPYLWTLRRFRGAAAFGQGMWFGFVFSYAAIFWLNSLRVFNPFVPVGIPLLALYAAFYQGVFGWLASWIWRRRRAAWIALPGAWILLEWFRTLGQLAFPWIFLSHTQVSNLPYIQMAEIGGAHIVSFCLVAINVLLVELLSPGGVSLKKSGRLLRVAGLTALIAGPYGYGAWRMGMNWNDGPALRVGVSQPNVDQITKFDSYANRDDEIRKVYQERIELGQINQVLKIYIAAPDTQLYVLPETSFTEGDFPSNLRLQGELNRLAKKVGGAILFGEDNDRWDEPTNRGQMYNSAWMAAPGRSVLDAVYNKMKLVPFGECLPHPFDYIPHLQDGVLGIGSFDRGTDYTLFEWAGLRFGCAICFETTAPRHVASFTQAGAQFLVFITNDAWYFLSRGPAQHDSIATFRAIESRRWVVRSANTGISRLIDPAGRTIKALPLGTAGFLTAEIHGRDGLTPYVRFGDWFVGLAGLATGGVFVVAWRDRKR